MINMTGIGKSGQCLLDRRSIVASRSIKKVVCAYMRPANSRKSAKDFPLMKGQKPDICFV